MLTKKDCLRLRKKVYARKIYQLLSCCYVKAPSKSSLRAGRFVLAYGVSIQPITRGQWDTWDTSLEGTLWSLSLSNSIAWRWQAVLPITAASNDTPCVASWKPSSLSGRTIEIGSMQGAGDMAQQWRATGWSSREPKFNSQHPHGTSQLSVTPSALGIWHPYIDIHKAKHQFT